MVDYKLRKPRKRSGIGCAALLLFAAVAVAAAILSVMQLQPDYQTKLLKLPAEEYAIVVYHSPDRSFAQPLATIVSYPPNFVVLERREDGWIAIELQGQVLWTLDTRVLRQ
jgi:hypothetical protein